AECCAGVLRAVRPGTGAIRPSRSPSAQMAPTHSAPSSAMVARRWSEGGAVASEPMLTRVAAERYARLLAFAVLLAGGRAAAEDLVQEGFVATFSARARFGSVDQAEAYVRRAIAPRFLDQG